MADRPPKRAPPGYAGLRVRGCTYLRVVQIVGARDSPRGREYLAQSAHSRDGSVYCSTWEHEDNFPDQRDIQEFWNAGRQLNGASSEESSDDGQINSESDLSEKVEDDQGKADAQDGPHVQYYANGHVQDSPATAQSGQSAVSGSHVDVEGDDEDTTASTHHEFGDQKNPVSISSMSSLSSINSDQSMSSVGTDAAIDAAIDAAVDATVDATVNATVNAFVDKAVDQAVHTAIDAAKASATARCQTNAAHSAAAGGHSNATHSATADDQTNATHSATDSDQTTAAQPTTAGDQSYGTYSPDANEEWTHPEYNGKTDWGPNMNYWNGWPDDRPLP